MKAVLPGWGWVVQSNAGAYGSGAKLSPSMTAMAEADTPARALLLAVLKALEATASASQSPAHLGNQEDSQ
jgi:ribonuclease HI